MLIYRRMLYAGFCVSVVGITGHSSLAEQPSGCATLAQRVVTETPGQLLSVTARRDRCQVVYLMQRDGQRPRRVVFDFENTIGGPVNSNGKRPGRGLLVPVRE